MTRKQLDADGRLVGQRDKSRQAIADEIQQAVDDMLVKHRPRVIRA